MVKMKLNVLQAIRNAGSRHASQRGVASIMAWLLLVFLSTAASAMATTYYVDSNAGSDSNAGTSLSSPFRSLQKVNAMNLMPGDSVLLNRGAAWSEGLQIQRSGLQGSDIFFGAYGSGAPPIIRYAKVDGDFVTLADLTVDRNKEAADAVQVTSDSCTLLNLTVRNGTRDGIDIHNSKNILIENCHVHHFLNGTFTNQADAHGIVATATQMLTIRNTEVHHVSGDSFQADPNRDPNNITNNILIENCHFWTGPLTEDFNSGWIKTSHLSDSQKQYPGENGIDTKVVKSGWDAVPRMLITILNTRFHGWKQDAYVNNKAALNLKEKIEAVIDGATVYDSEIGFRLRGGMGNANVRINNTHIYNCDYAIRTEDDLQNLTISGSIFGDNSTMLRIAASTSGFSTWNIANNYFLNSKPELASDPSNQVITEAEYIELVDAPAAEAPAEPQNLRLMAVSDPGEGSNDDSEDDGTGSNPGTGDDTDPVTGDHAHFKTESAKSGVVFSRSYRSQAEINQDWYIYARRIPACDDPCDISLRTGAAFYSIKIDGAILPYYAKTASGQLRQSEDEFITPEGTDVYVQYEIFIDSALYSDLMTWDNDKKFRVVAKNVSDSSDRLLTQQWVGWDNDAVWFAFSSAGVGDIKTGYSLPADSWQRITLRFGFANDIFEAWVTDIATGEIRKIASVQAPGFTGKERIYGAWPMASSSDRDEVDTTGDPDIEIGFRNIVVSTNPIAK